MKLIKAPPAKMEPIKDNKEIPKIPPNKIRTKAPTINIIANDNHPSTGSERSKSNILKSFEKSFLKLKVCFLIFF